MDKQYYKEYYHLEREHWWFKARLEILEMLVIKHFGMKPGAKILNAGAATGATSVMLKKYGETTSLEYDRDCAEFLAEKLNEKVVNESLTELPMEEKSFDLVCAFDVVEHIEDDDLAVKEIHRVLRNNGNVFITVPAFSFLWSKHDEINHHFRRYTIKELVGLLERNGFEVSYRSYFNFILFLPIAIVRIFSGIFSSQKKEDSTGSDFEKFSGNNFLNKLLYRLFKLEAGLLKRSIYLPFGVSAMVVGRKVQFHSKLCNQILQLLHRNMIHNHHLKPFWILMVIRY